MYLCSTLAQISFFKDEALDKRIFGLDVLRFFAIFFVVIGHSKILLPESVQFWVDNFILDGVSIFFVLSGFLIGGILIKTIEQKPSTLQTLFHFWNRRWLRTLPAYILVLTFLVIYTYSLKPTRLPVDVWKYYLFIQNVFAEQPAFFSESWSLSIEEWFYLTVPFILFLGLYFFPKMNKKIYFFYLLCIILIGVICLRHHLYFKLNPLTEKSIDLGITRQVFSRLDAILIGVFAAYLMYYFPKIWEKIDISWLLTGLFALYFLKFFNRSNTSYYFAVLLPFIKAICVGMMLPVMQRWKQIPHRFWTWITAISLISYSMYLVNRTIVIDILFKFALHDNLKSKHELTQTWFLEYILFWVVTCVLSYLLYRFVEKPFMRLRK